MRITGMWEIRLYGENPISIAGYDYNFEHYLKRNNRTKFIMVTSNIHLLSNTHFVHLGTFSKRN